MNTIKHDAAPRRKTGGSKIFLNVLTLLLHEMTFQLLLSP